jgi:glutamyl-tRNA synthetase
MGILPEALLNYLARLCWGHGDDEIFDIDQFIQWFDLDNISGSPARFDMKKLYWVNAEHIKRANNQKLSFLVKQLLDKKQININGSLDLNAIVELVKARADNLNILTDECACFYQPLVPSSEEIAKHLTASSHKLLLNFASELDALDSWSLDNIKQLVKDFCTKYTVKMPELGMPLRLKLCGTTKTPSFDAVIFLLGKDLTLKRLND